MFSLNEVIIYAKGAILNGGCKLFSWGIDNVRKIELGDICDLGECCLMIERCGSARLYPKWLNLSKPIMEYENCQRLKELYKCIADENDFSRMPTKEELDLI